MDAPLGCAVGNAVEIRECLDTLSGGGPPDLADVALRLAARMVLLAGVESEAAPAEARVREALSSGRALETFRRMVERQGGNPRVVDDPSLLPDAPGRATVTARRGGYLIALRAEAIGRASNVLGAGRSDVRDPVDHGVGVVLRAKPGDRVGAGDPLLELHHRAGRGLEAALDLCERAVDVADEAPPPRRKILAEVR
jgi:thymidine phosphorylase